MIEIDDYFKSIEMQLYINEESGKAFLEREMNINENTLPLDYDLRKLRPECFTPVKDQGDCGSCYTFATTAALESRYCLQSNGRLKPELSQSYILSCDNQNKKCQGTTLLDTWKYLENNGTCDYACKPYQSKYGYIPKCNNKCNFGWGYYNKWRAKPGSFKIFTSNEQIKADIYHYGPVSTLMITFEDLKTYKSRIYVHTIGKRTVIHAVIIFGWGYDTSNKKEYWVIRNYWGPNWGEMGYFKILFEMYLVPYTASVSQPLL